MTQGIPKGSSKMPDSPESAGFFDATRNTQANRARKAIRKMPADSNPVFDFRSDNLIMAGWPSTA